MPWVVWLFGHLELPNSTRMGLCIAARSDMILT